MSRQHFFEHGTRKEYGNGALITVGVAVVLAVAYFVAVTLHFNGVI